MEGCQLNKFTTAHNLKPHPAEKLNQAARRRYLEALTCLIQRYNPGEYEEARLFQYYSLLPRVDSASEMAEKEERAIIKAVVNPVFRPWTWRDKIWLMCDVAMISQSYDSINRTQTIMNEFLNTKQQALMDLVTEALLHDAEIPPKLTFAQGAINQFRANRKFLAQPELRILVTANMSAGKSTLINALVGKPIARTAQEACTANLCYIFNIPFEDHAIHSLSPQLNLNASYEYLVLHKDDAVSYIASYFRNLASSTPRICFIDTPGVNSAMHKGHRDITQHALENETYDKLVYVLNANKLGTDEELTYLKYIAENIPQEKIVFVLNKLDDFKRSDDSILDSLGAVRNDLCQLGFQNPIICPLSAYCAWLAKMKYADEILTEDEEDMYQFYLNKFQKSEYNLSTYYQEVGSKDETTDTECMTLIRRCGIYGLENILYGGTNR